MKTRLTLDEAWEKCLATWEEVVKRFEKTGNDIDQIKAEAIGHTNVLADCWFCEYSFQNRGKCREVG